MIRTEAMRRSFMAEHSPQHSTDEMRERPTSVSESDAVIQAGEDGLVHSKYGPDTASCQRWQTLYCK